MKSLITTFLAITVISIFSFSQTVVTYNIEVDSLIGLEETSGDICTAPFTVEEVKQLQPGNSWGAMWTSTNAGTPTAIEVSLTFSVSEASVMRPTTLNGNSNNMVDPGAAYNCEVGTMLTWTIDPTGYVPMGLNTFLVDYSGSTTIHQVDNISMAQPIDPYFIVTVTYAPCLSVMSTDSRTECDSLLWIDGNTYYANNNSATFNITGGAANLCDSLVTLDLTINTVNSSVTQTGTLLTANESGATYQWLDCPAMTPIIGATGQSYSATVNGDYAVIVNNNGCSGTSSCYSVIGVGIIENNFDNELLIYPNPTNGNFSIDLGNNYQSTTVTITDLSARTIQTKRYNDSQLLDLKLKEPAGVYLLIIQSDKKKAVIRLVKE